MIRTVIIFSSVFVAFEVFFFLTWSTSLILTGISVSFCRSKATRREQIPWHYRRMRKLFLKQEISLTLNDQYYKSLPLRWNDLLTFTSRRITLFFIPQSTATTFVAFPLPYTLTSCHFKNQRVRGKFQIWAIHQYRKHIGGCFTLRLMADWLLSIWEWLAINQFVRKTQQVLQSVSFLL